MPEAATSGELPASGLLILPLDAVPARWRERSEAVALIRLLPGEVTEVLEERPALPGILVEDEALLRLIARGHTVSEVSQRLGSSSRTVERRLARLREVLGVSSKEQLVAYLARVGF